MSSDRAVVRVALVLALAALPVAVTSACRGGLTLDSTQPLDASVSGDGSAIAADGPYRVTCSLYHRTPDTGRWPEHDRIPIVFRTNEPAETLVDVPASPISLRASLREGATPDALVLSMIFPRSGLTQTFELSKNRQPSNELLGSHGFTGLNYVTTDGSNVEVQYICESSPLDEERPKPHPIGGGSDDPAAMTKPVRQPVKIRCDLAWNEGAETRAETVSIEQPTDRTIAAGPFDVRVAFFDSPYEGRSLVLNARMRGGGGNEFQQLLQIDPTNALANLGSESGFTGRVTLHNGDGSDAGSAADGGTASSVTLSCSSE